MECKKTRFASEEAAKFYLDKIKLNSNRDKIPIRAYKCACGAWHLTKRVRIEDVEEENLQLRELTVELVEKNENLKAEIKNLTKRLKVQDKATANTEPAYKQLKEKINKQQRQIKDLQDIRNQLFAQLQKFTKK